MRSNEHLKNSRTVRELGGEIWSELSNRIDEAVIDWKTKNDVVDLVMGVLARHVGATLANDIDLPVEPLGTMEKRDPG
jgi:hypothetical protein